MTIAAYGQTGEAHVPWHASVCFGAWAGCKARILPRSARKDAFNLCAACRSINPALIHHRNPNHLKLPSAGSGKTHSMMGDRGDPGMVPMLLVSMFNHAAAQQGEREFSFRLSGMEIYNEQVGTQAVVKTSCMSGNMDCSADWGTPWEPYNKHVVELLVDAEPIATCSSHKLAPCCHCHHVAAQLFIVILSADLRPANRPPRPHALEPEGSGLRRTRRLQEQRRRRHQQPRCLWLWLRGGGPE